MKICHGYGWKVSKLEICQTSALLVPNCSAIKIKFLIAFYITRQTESEIYMAGSWSNTVLKK